MKTERPASSSFRPRLNQSIYMFFAQSGSLPSSASHPEELRLGLSGWLRRAGRLRGRTAPSRTNTATGDGCRLHALIARGTQTEMIGEEYEPRRT
jgi:hypothetical protein